MKAYAIFAIAFLIAIVGATALPINIDTVEIDNIVLTQNSVNTLSLERGEEYQVRVAFTPTQDLDNVEVRVSITGYEFNDIQEIDDKTSLFDADANVTYVKKLNIVVPDDVDEDNYKLRIYVSDRYNDATIQTYNLKVDLPRNSLKIEDVILNPTVVKSGSALLTTVRVENKGEKDQKDVKVTVSIPELGISATEYIEEIESADEEEETEEIFLRIPSCAKAGNYDVNVEVEYSQKHQKITQKETIAVLADETCNEQEKTTTILQNSQPQNVQPEQTAIFPVTITNTAKTSKTFTITLQNTNWAQTTITPTSMVVLPAGQTQTIFVNIIPQKETPQGAHSITATITSGNYNEQTTFTVNVLEQNNSAKTIFESILVVLLVILVIIGIVIAIMHFKGKDEPQTYY